MLRAETLRQSGPIGWLIPLLLILSVPAIAADNDTVLKPGHEERVERGLSWLAARQVTEGPDRGSWIADVGFKLNDNYRVTQDKSGHVGVTSLACMAFMAGGHLPGRGKYGDVVEEGLQYVLRAVSDEDGYVTDNGTRMYSHAFATLFLAEIYGMTKRADVRAKLQLAIDLIVRSQNESGSWRYLPMAKDSDMSITVCQVMALRAARNIGIKVPRTTIDRAIEYVKNSAVREDQYSRYNFGRGRNEKGSFKYQLKEGARSSFPLTAAGITTLYGAGIYSDADIDAGLQYLRTNYDDLIDFYRYHYFFYYGNYYAVQATYIAGGKAWTWYWNRITDDLFQNQQPDGNWKNNVGPGDSFATAVACLILQIPYGYLPIFQR
ncbi:MAG: terpene cyclase/mutase family protein [Planctomycetota bacterium]